MSQETPNGLGREKFASVMGTPGRVRVGLFALGCLAAVLAGLIGLLFPTEYSPAYIGGAIIGLVVLAAFLHKPVWALYMVLFVVLLPTGLFPTNLQSNINRVMTVVALSIWLFSFLFVHRKFAWSPTMIFMLGFLVWSSISLLWVKDLNTATTVLQTYILRFIVYLVLVYNLVRNKESLNGLMKTLAISGLVLSIVSLAYIATGGYTPSQRLQVLGVNENALGILALVTLLGVLWMAMYPPKRMAPLANLVAFSAMLVSIVLIVLSGSRGSAISLVVTLFAFLFFKSTRRWGVMGLIILGVGAIVAPFLFSTTIERFAASSSGSDTLLGGREVIWQAAWLLVKDHPLVGVGIGNAGVYLASYLQLFTSVLNMNSQLSTHNPPLMIWVETGLVGLVLYLGVLVSAVWTAVRTYFRNRRAGANMLTAYFALIAAGFIGYFLSWIKGGGSESDFSYFMMLALLLVPSAMDQREFQENGQPKL